MGLSKLIEDEFQKRLEYKKHINTFKGNLHESPLFIPIMYGQSEETKDMSYDELEDLVLERTNVFLNTKVNFIKVKCN